MPYTLGHTHFSSRQVWGCAAEPKESRCQGYGPTHDLDSARYGLTSGKNFSAMGTDFSAMLAPGL
jgi:hypothetical protein